MKKEDRSLPLGSEEETLCFLVMCSETDRKFLDIPKKKRPIETYARLMSIALILGFKGIFLKLVGEGDNVTDEIIACIEQKANDFAVVDGWMLDFIDAIRFPSLKLSAQQLWEKQRRDIDPKNFRFADLIRADITPI